MKYRCPTGKMHKPAEYNGQELLYREDTTTFVAINFMHGACPFPIIIDYFRKIICVGHFEYMIADRSPHYYYYYYYYYCTELKKKK